MKALLVSVNGKRFCLAGIGDNGVMSANVTIVRGKALEGRGTLGRRAELFVGGLNSVTAEHHRWHRAPKRINVGDEVTIKVVEASTVDPATASYRPMDAEKKKKPRRRPRRTAR